MPSKSWAGFRSIVCPVDFSEPSQLALKFAASLAARAHATLTVHYASDPLLVAAASAALHDRGMVRRSATELKRFVDETLGRVSRRFRLKTRVSVGDSSDAILKAAAAVRSDLIVMGTHGLTGADRLFMGSTTLSVLQQTSVPVLAVPPSIGLATELSSWPLGRIVAAVDLDRRSRAEVETSARIARWFGAPLLLLHVLSEVGAPAWLRGALSDQERIRVGRAKRDLEALAGIARRVVEAESRVVCGRPAAEIAAVVAAEKAGLLITMLRDRRGWFGTRRGSASYHVLSYAVAPVLACPPQWRPR